MARNRLALFSILITACGAPAGGPDDGGTPGDGGNAMGDDARVLLPDGGSADGGGGGGDAGERTCPPPPACDVPLPDLGPTDDWRHELGALFTTSQGPARHRGRDLILRQSDPQWALAKFAYGLADDDLEDEDVDLYLLRGCTGSWEHIATVTTTDDGSGAHPTVEGVEDDGGRVYFQIPSSMRLGPGRHRIHFVVRGDHTSADQIIHVLDGTERWVVSDVDGTLTESETAEFLTLLNGPSPDANPSAPEALWSLARRGYQILYLTARPDWLGARTYEWLPERGFPPGIIHTTLSDLGGIGSRAVTFKTGELMQLAARTGAPPDIAIGNTDTDAEAYANAAVPNRYLYQLTGNAMGGTVFDDYADLVTTFDALPAVCP